MVTESVWPAKLNPFSVWTITGDIGGPVARSVQGTANHSEFPAQGGKGCEHRLGSEVGQMIKAVIAR